MDIQLANKNSTTHHSTDHVHNYWGVLQMRANSANYADAIWVSTVSFNSTICPKIILAHKKRSIQKCLHYWPFVPFVITIHARPGNPSVSCSLCHAPTSLLEMRRTLPWLVTCWADAMGNSSTVLTHWADTTPSRVGCYLGEILRIVHSDC